MPNPTTMNVQLLQLIKTTAQWENFDTPIPAGMICIEETTSGDHLAKVGAFADNGQLKTYAQLDYINKSLIDEAIADLGQFMEFKGILATLPTTAEAGTYKVGDVLLIGAASNPPTTNDYTEYVCTAVTPGSEEDDPDTLTWEELGPIGMEVKPYVGRAGITIEDGTGDDAGKKVVKITNSIIAGNTSGTGVTSGTATTTTFGSNVEIPYITYNAQGSITSGTGVRTFALPNETFSGPTTDGGSDGVKGLVPIPTYAQKTNGVLRGDGWASLTAAATSGITVTNTTGNIALSINPATASDLGGVYAPTTSAISISETSGSKGLIDVELYTNGGIAKDATTGALKLTAADTAYLGGVSVAADSAISNTSGAIDVKLGEGLGKDNSNNVALSVATDSTLGGVKVTSGSAIDISPTTGHVGEIDIKDVSGLSAGTTSDTGSTSSTTPTTTVKFGDTISGTTITNNAKGQITAIGNTYWNLPDNTFSAETAASAGNNTKGLVNGPTYENTAKFLKGNGTWASAVTDVSYDTTGSNPQIKVGTDGGTATAIVTVTDNTTATALSASDANLVTARSVANAGFGKTINVANGTATPTSINADSNGVFDLTDLILQCTL